MLILMSVDITRNIMSMFRVKSDTRAFSLTHHDSHAEVEELQTVAEGAEEEPAGRQETPKHNRHPA